MKTLLAIETSGSVCSVAVSIGGSLTSSVEILRPNVHDAILAKTIQQACDAADVRVADVDLVAVSSGPGSFTGLRIGVSMAKGLCAASGAQLLGVPSTTALMHASTEVAQRCGAHDILAIIPSHQDLYYVACSEVNNETHLAPVSLVRASAITELANTSTMVVGPGAHVIEHSPISGLTRHSARFVAFAAWRLLQAGHPTDDPITFGPEYFQEFQPR